MTRSGRCEPRTDEQGLLRKPPRPGEAFCLDRRRTFLPIKTTVLGAYPKPPEEGKPFTLRKTLHALERGDVTQEDVTAAVRELTKEMIAEQEAAGIDLVTSGHASWEDILTPFARHMAGFEIGGLIRWFDNNVYYRRPVATGPIEWR